jgi:hypothetical protein
MKTKSNVQTKALVDFCNDFGLHSERMERFFKGMVYFLSLRHFTDASQLPPSLSDWDEEFKYFLKCLQGKTLSTDL